MDLAEWLRAVSQAAAMLVEGVGVVIVVIQHSVRTVSLFLKRLEHEPSASAAAPPRPTVTRVPDLARAVGTHSVSIDDKPQCQGMCPEGQSSDRVRSAPGGRAALSNDIPHGDQGLRGSSRPRTYEPSAK
jgi:hypothetical protein